MKRRIEQRAEKPGPNHVTSDFRDEQNEFGQTALTRNMWPLETHLMESDEKEPRFVNPTSHPIGSQAHKISAGCDPSIKTNQETKIRVIPS